MLGMIQKMDCSPSLRWGDAPVHTLAVALLMDPNEVHFFEEIGYDHDGILHCPEGGLNKKCRCNPHQDTGRNNPYNCYDKFSICYL